MPLPSLQRDQSEASIAGEVIAINSDRALSPIADVEIRLLSETGQELATQRTTAAGKFMFADLPAGSYGIAQVQPEGYENFDVEVGNAGGSAVTPNLIVDIAIGAESAAGSYQFVETPTSLTSNQGTGFQIPKLLPTHTSGLPSGAISESFVGIDLTPGIVNQPNISGRVVVNLPASSATTANYEITPDRSESHVEELPLYGGGGKQMDAELAELGGLPALGEDLVDLGSSLVSTLFPPVRLPGAAWKDAASQLGSYFLQQWAFQQLAPPYSPSDIGAAQFPQQLADRSNQTSADMPSEEEIDEAIAGEDLTVEKRRDSDHATPTPDADNPHAA